MTVSEIWPQDKSSVLPLQDRLIWQVSIQLDIDCVEFIVNMIILQIHASRVCLNGNIIIDIDEKYINKIIIYMQSISN